MLDGTLMLCVVLTIAVEPQFNGPLYTQSPQYNEQIFFSPGKVTGTAYDKRGEVGGKKGGGVVLKNIT